MQLNLIRNMPARPDYWSRRSGQPVAQGALQLSPVANRATVGNVPVFLRPLEFRLLYFLMSHPDEVHSRERLLEEIWDECVIVGPRTVDVHIRRLRSVLQPFGLDKLVQTVHRRGYLFSGAASVTTPTTATIIN